MIKKIFWVLATFVLFSSKAFPSLGPFEHGAGLKSMGMGGVSYVNSDEATNFVANPANLSYLGKRLDVGFNVMMLNPEIKVSTSEIEKYKSRRVWALLPQFGFSYPISEETTFGITMVQAGLGPKYKKNPYEKFNGGNQSSLKLGSINVASAFSWKPYDNHSFGGGLVLGYKLFSVRGLKFLTSNEEGEKSSKFPDNVSNKGKDYSSSVGVTLGWSGDINDDISVGVGYRKTLKSTKFKKYKGLLPDKGLLELPPSYGAAVSWAASKKLKVCFEWQKYSYKGTKAFSNSISNLSKGNMLGDDNGPGFGWDDQAAVKIGAEYSYSDRLDLRIGYLSSNQAIKDDETLFNILAPTVVTKHVTGGFTYKINNNEFTGMFTFSPKETVSGNNSIPNNLGGGEVNITNDFYSFGLSFGKVF